MHCFCTCSKSVEKEAERCDERRICIACQRLLLTIVQDIATLNEVENWHGLTKLTSKSRYLRATFKDNEVLLHEKLRKV